MTLAIEHDRPAQLVAGYSGIDFDAAQARLAKATLYLTWDKEIAAERWLQAALFALVTCGQRMFPGGVFLAEDIETRCTLTLKPAYNLRSQLLREGAKPGHAPKGAMHIHVGGEQAASANLYCGVDGWAAVVGPKPSEPKRGNEVSGILAAAIALAEGFRLHVLEDKIAGRRQKRVCAWGPDAPEDGAIARLPSLLWLLGLGNLGQAALFTLGMLPYADPSDLHLLLQDNDIVGPENLAVQLLTQPHWVGRRKARMCAEWAESQGFVTDIVETRFATSWPPAKNEPRILLAGVDNLEARRLAAKAGFDLVIDAGLGATSADAFDLRIHAFPGARTANQAWPIQETATVEPKLLPAHEKLVEQGRIDRCGAISMAGKSVGVPCTALAAAAIQIAQLLRALASDRCCDLIDVSLPAAASGHFQLMGKPVKSRLAWLAA